MKIKKDMIEMAHRLTGIRKADCGVIVDSILELIAQSMISGEGTGIRGLGEFTSFVRPAFIGRNPKSGAPLPFKATRIPRFKPSTILRARAAEAYRETQPENQQTEIQ